MKFCTTAAAGAAAAALLAAVATTRCDNNKTAASHAHGEGAGAAEDTEATHAAVPDAAFRTAGVAVERGYIPLGEAHEALLQALVSSYTPPADHILTHYEKAGSSSTVPARVERLCTVPGPTADLEARARALAEAKTGRKLRLFKDKINFKFPGGTGWFVPHQDSPAYYPHGSWHVSVLVPLTEFTNTSGTLEFAPLAESAVPMEELEKLDYTSVELAVGDVVVFDGLTPHRSGENLSGKPRIGLYITFTDAGEGDVSAAYYAAKAAGIKGMSLNQVDFTGNLVPPAWADVVN